MCTYLITDIKFKKVNSVTLGLWCNTSKVINVAEGILTPFKQLVNETSEVKSTLQLL